MKILHCSDLHFSHFVTNPLQFLSKTWIGNANLLLKRGKRLQPIDAEPFLKTIEALSLDLILISGDFTTTSQPQEFEKAKEFIELLKQEGYKIVMIPGNHDNYTKKAHQKQLFYHYLSPSIKPSCSLNLKSDGITFYEFPDCNLILLDLSLVTPWFTAYGVFSSRHETHLKNLINQINSDKPLVVSGHFPILSETNHYHHALKHGERLFEILNQHPHCYYLHGHNHKQTIMKKENLVQIDSGSLSDIQKGSFCVLETHKGIITHYYRQKDGIKKGTSHERKMV